MIRTTGKESKIHPTLNVLPIPPFGKSGWPWTEENPSLPNTMPNGRPWPMVSIVTPSYNQAQFLEETIRSVLLQGYPNLEYIIMDGGSTDGSLDIIHKYKPWLSYWVSKPDNGQSNAINNGWLQAHGEIIAYINSDDTYEIGAFENVAKYFSNHTDVDMMYGDCNMIDEDGRFIKDAPTMDYDFKALVCNKWFIPQQAAFIRRKVLEKIVGVDESLYMVMDWDLWLRIAMNGFKICYYPHKLASFRIWGESKTSSQSLRSGKEKIAIINNLFRDPNIFQTIRPFKKTAYSRVHSFIGAAYCANYNRKKAFYHLLASIKYCPSRLKEKRIIKLLIISLIGRPLSIRLKGWYLYLSGMFKRNFQ